MRAICKLFYVSKAAMPYDDRTVQEILQTSRRNNSKLDVTGCLLFSGCFFAQVLEGDATVVHALADRIAADERHLDVKFLIESHEPTRVYRDWSMGFLHDLGLEDELQALLEGSGCDAEAIADMMTRMQPDSVMGALG